jgi:hypothetical protein
LKHAKTKLMPFMPFHDFLMFFWPRQNIFFVSIFIFTCFCVSAFVIPESISFGESLCFAFTFSMMQMVELGLFLRHDGWKNSCVLCMSLCSGCVLPSVQIYLVMQGEYTSPFENICGYLYMVKEILLFLLVRNSLQKVLVRVHLMIIVIWTVSEIIFLILSVESYSKDTLDKVIYVLRLSPLFCMAFLTLVRMTNMVPT